MIGRSASTRALLVGSHIESQSYAGRLDGPLGLLYALAAVRALSDADIVLGAQVFAEGIRRILGATNSLH